MASIIERIDLGCANSPMRVLISLTAASAAIGANGPPNPRASRLEPRPFSISLVNSFGGDFVWLYISIHAPISS